MTALAPNEPAAPGDSALECFRLGREYFPEINWSKNDFRRAFQEQHRSNTPGRTNEDEYIRLACLQGIPEALPIFDRYYIKPLLPALLRITGSADVADAALQKLREKLLLPPQRRLALYKESGTFRAWLRVVATRTALDELRSRGGKRRTECQLEEHLETLAPNPEQRVLREEWRLGFRNALRAAILRLSQRERQCLRLHLVAEWSVTQIGRAFSVHRATAARWLVSGKQRLHELLREELLKLGASQDLELADFLLEIPTQIDLRLSQLFATTGVIQLSQQV